MKTRNPLEPLQARIKRNMSRGRLRDSDEEHYCVMVHAGAGYHSKHNEHIHLEVVEDACVAGRDILTAGGTAVEAVEAIIKHLEDKEITNSGYGSNLSMDGVVECDASIVDHLGRSGGVGAVTQVKNPIMAARAVLVQSTKLLSLRRVPPNLLVGQGATDFAFNKGLTILPHDYLVSRGARERWLEWRQTLEHAERKARRQLQTVHGSNGSEAMTANDARQLEEAENRKREAHTKLIMMPEWTAMNAALEAQLPSINSRASNNTTIYSVHTTQRSEEDRVSADVNPDFTESSLLHQASANGFMNSSQHIPSLGGLCHDSGIAGKSPPTNTTDDVTHEQHRSDSVYSGRSLDLNFVFPPHHQGKDPAQSTAEPVAVLAEVESKDDSSDDGHEKVYAAPLPPSGGYFEDLDEDDELYTAPPDAGAFLCMSQSDSPSIGSVEAQNGDAGDGSDSSYESSLELPSLTPSPTRCSSPETIVHDGDKSTTSINPADIPLPPSPEPGSESPSPATCTPLHHVREASPYPPWPTLAASAPPAEDRDNITDTVGAIAIDRYGNIACGASSGGIGLKFRGRVGPAALNGIGSYVKPIDPDDRNKTTVACVTSGTGETIATTMAAAVCSERLYDSVKKIRGGSTERCDDEDVLKAFIEKDFMAHPSVKNSRTFGAIGLLTVKKSKDGVRMYYAHNTDSFVLASMSAKDQMPVSCMSRKGVGSIATGARALRPSARRR